MPQIGPMELLIVLGIVIVIFGAGKISDLGGALGKGIREFREQTKDKDEAQDTTPVATTPVATTPVAAVAVPVAPAAVAPAATTIGTCPSCGRENPASQPFCGSCGASLATPATRAGA
jgi:sec-independent protein translocase protein TatA